MAFTPLYSAALPSAAVIFLIFYLVRLIRNKFKPVLRNIPGPPLAAFTNLWRFLVVTGRRIEEQNLRWHRIYGPLVRMGPNVISVGDPAMIPVIYTAKGEFAKTGFYPVQALVYKGVPQSNIFTEQSEKIHREYKRRMAHEYSLDFFLRMEDQFDDVGRLFMQKLGNFADKKEAFDFGSWLQYYAFDVVGEISISQKYGFLEQGVDLDGTIETIARILGYASIVGQIPQLHTLLINTPVVSSIIQRINAWGEIERYTLKHVTQRTWMDEQKELHMQEGKMMKDQLSSWMNKPNVKTIEMVGFSMGNVVAGSDTTAIALRSIFYYLLKNRDKYLRLEKEIEDADKAGKLSTPVKHKEVLNKLPYLQAVVKEAMRKHTSIAMILERHVPEGGAIICGHHIPAGTIVGINPHVVHHDPGVFPNPEKFEPERWLPTGAEGDKERLVEMERAWIPFGAGSRTCLGRNLSTVEMRKIVPEIIRRFEITMPEEEEWVSSNKWFNIQQMPKCIVRRKEQKLQ